MSNRILKFRVWDKQKNEFFIIKNGMSLGVGNTDKFLAFNTNQGAYWIPNTGQVDLGWDRWIIQQFTGFLDRENEEVYEGDIVEYVEGVELGDKFREVGIVKYDEYMGSFGFSDSLEEDCKNYKWEGVVGHIKVIGNIFENKDLIIKK